MQDRRDQLSDVERASSAVTVTEELVQLVVHDTIDVIHCYITLGSEVDTMGFLNFCVERGKTVVVPRTLPNRRLQHLVYTSPSNLSVGRFGTRFPADMKEFEGKPELIVVPGLAFSFEGDRLGYGAGYYDTFLAENEQALKVGVCYVSQVIDEVPTEAHDVRLDRIIAG